MFPDPDAVHAQPLSHDHLHVQEGNPEQEEQEEVYQDKVTWRREPGAVLWAARSPGPHPLYDSFCPVFYSYDA